MLFYYYLFLTLFSSSEQQQTACVDLTEDGDFGREGWKSGDAGRCKAQHPICPRQRPGFCWFWTWRAPHAAKHASGLTIEMQAQIGASLAPSREAPPT